MNDDRMDQILHLEGFLAGLDQGFLMSTEDSRMSESWAEGWLIGVHLKTAIMSEKLNQTGAPSLHIQIPERGEVLDR